jgi:hypothetical protein
MATTRPTKNEASAPDAVQLLTADHKAVKAMFKEFETLKKNDAGDEAKAELVHRICTGSPFTPPSRKRSSTLL